MKSIYIFRHGETDWNAQGRFQGQLDIPLNDRGRNQARQLVSQLGAAGIEAILSSDLSRARETAEIAAQVLDIPVFLNPGLREAHLGECEGKTITEIESQVGIELVRRWKSYDPTDADVSYPGGETGEAVIQRAFDAMRTFLVAHSYQRIGVSSHGGVIRRLAQRILPSDSGPIPIPNGVLYRIDYVEEQDRWQFTVK